MIIHWNEDPFSCPLSGAVWTFFNHIFLSPPPPFFFLLACYRGWWCTRIPLPRVWKIDPKYLRRKKVSESPPPPPPLLINFFQDEKNNCVFPHDLVQIDAYVSKPIYCEQMFVIHVTEDEKKPGSIIISLSFYSASYKSLCALPKIQINEKYKSIKLSIAYNFISLHKIFFF